MSSREHLDMDRVENGVNQRGNSAAATQNKIDFEVKKGCFLERGVIVFICLVTACAIVAVGLLVAYFGACSTPTSVDDSPKSPAEQSKIGVPKVRPYLKLPTSIIPEHYIIELQPFLIPGNFTINGKTTIRVRCDQETSNITLHVKDLVINVDSLQLKRRDGSTQGVPNIKNTKEDIDKQFFILNLEGNLQAGVVYEVSMSFVAIVNDNLAGFYRSSYKDKDGNTRWVANTQFQPTDARRAFPCFDEPALKATFDIVLVRLKNMTSISNMLQLRSEPRPEGYVADYYNTTVKMSTYLLAFVVSDFTFLKSPSQHINFRVWARTDVIDQARYSLRIGPEILKYYEKYFNITYPLPKVDMFAAPDFAAGAMENWGLIIYRETAMLVDPKQSSSANRQRVAVVVSHELAHQWFGNLVTPQWWDDLWLNEGFASYVEYLGIDAVHPEWKMHDQFVVDQVQNSMSLDGLKSSHPISVPVYRPEDVNEIFDRISYGKGCSIIRMMRFFLGASTFQKGLTNYLNAKMFSNAVQNDLWMYLSKAAEEDGKNINVRQVMDSWTLQTGFPVVDMIRNYEDETVKLTQSRFLFDATNKSGSQIWEIPLTFTSSADKDWDPEKIVVWLNKRQDSLKKVDGVPAADQWIVANIHETGFYKVNYDIKNWKMLINQLQTNRDEIPITNRAQLIDDALDLAKAGLLDYALALNITLYLDKETEFVPWNAAIINLHYIDKMLSTTPAYGKWKQYLLKKVLPLYDRIGWEEKSNESVLEQYKRVGALSWACKYGHKHCVDRAKSMFKQWMAGNENPTSPNLRSVVYCTAVANGGDEEFNFAWSQYHLTKVASERDKLMSAMSCSQQPWIISTLMQRAMNSSSGIRKQDAAFVFRFMSSQVVGSLLSFNFVRNNWPLIYKVYGDSFFSLSGIIRSISSRLNTRFQLEELKKFYIEQKTLNRLGTAKRAFEQSIETAKVNVYWNEKNFKPIDRWLENILKGMN